jgi:hypothetical protein
LAVKRNRSEAGGFAVCCDFNGLELVSFRRAHRRPPPLAFCLTEDPLYGEF